MMHREVIERRKIPVITMVLFIVTIGLYLSQGIRLVGLNNEILGYALNGMLLLFIVALVFKQVKSCNIAYRYAIIADKLIINRINSKQERNLESIKIADILYVGKKSEMPREYTKVKTSKSYLCNRIGDEIYSCIYKNGDKVTRFNFQPSGSFIQRILLNGKSCCKLNQEYKNKD